MGVGIAAGGGSGQGRNYNIARRAGRGRFFYAGDSSRAGISLVGAKAAAPLKSVIPDEWWLNRRVDYKLTGNSGNSAVEIRSVTSYGVHDPVNIPV